MFTGIVQARGIVQSVERGAALSRLAVYAPALSRPIALGASVCVSGVCLTVTASDAETISFDIIPETLTRSTLGELAPGDAVNLEASLRAGDRLDGHMVQGHVDGTAHVTQILSDDGGHVVWFELEPELMPFVIPKGSIAIAGVSLTIAAVEGNRFSVALIPTTLDATTLRSLRVGDKVNIETDIVARTVVSSLQRWREMPSQSGLTLEMLRENGW